MSAFTKLATDAYEAGLEDASRLAQAEVDSLRSLVSTLTARVEEAERRIAIAVDAVAAPLYFDDSSDFGTGLWQALAALRPDWEEQCNEGAITEAMYTAALDAASKEKGK